MSSVAALLLKSIGAGYSALNIAGRDNKIKILEFAPLGIKSHALFLGQAQDLQNFIISLRTTDIERSIVIPDCPETILQNYAGQNTSHYQDFALLFESHFVGDLLRYSVEFSKLDLKVVDFRIQRTSDSAGYLVMTGSDANKVKESAQDLKRENVKITYLPLISNGFRVHMDVIP